MIFRLKLLSFVKPKYRTPKPNPHIQFCGKLARIGREQRPLLGGSEVKPPKIFLFRGIYVISHGSRVVAQLYIFSSCIYKFHSQNGEEIL